MAEELKACPFCGGEPKTSHRPESEAAGGGHKAFVVCYCDGYASTAHQMGHAETVQAAIAEVVEKWNTRAQLPIQGGESVEVVATVEAYGGKWAGIHWGECIGSTEDPERQLMTVAQHQRILLSTVIRCEQKGAFKTCLECGYQDGHDLICQYHESKRAAVSDDLTNVRCLCCQSEHAHNSYDAGFIAGSGMCQACDAALPAKDIVSTTHPADQVADDLTMVKVSRDLLKRLQISSDCYDPKQSAAVEELRALLAKSEVAEK